MRYSGITAKQAHTLLNSWIELINKKTKSLDKGARFYLWMFYMSIPFMGITKVLAGGIGVSLMSHEEGGDPILSEFTAGLIITLAVIIDSIITLAREGINSRQKASDCSSAKKKYENLVEMMKLQLVELENNVFDDVPRSEIMEKMKNISMREEMIKIDEPDFVWIGHNSARITMAADNILDKIQSNGGIVQNMGDIANIAEKFGIMEKILASDISHESVEKLFRKVEKYTVNL